MRALLGLCLVALLFGCATVPEPAPEREKQAAWRARLAELSAVEQFSLKGRIAVRIDDEGWQASLRWRQQGEAYDIHIFGPFGRNIARLEGDEDHAVLRTADGESFAAPDAEGLMVEQLGWQLPVSGLRHWVLGVPAPEEATRQVTLDDLGRPAALRQSGWEVTYPKYKGDERNALPGRVQLSQSVVSIKLLVDEWQLSMP